MPAACLTASPGGVPAVRVFLLLSLIIYINIDIVNKIIYIYEDKNKQNFGAVFVHYYIYLYRYYAWLYICPFKTFLYFKVYLYVYGIKMRIRGLWCVVRAVSVSDKIFLHGIFTT